MLERVQAEVREIGSLWMTVHAEHATFVVKMVIEDDQRSHAALAPGCLNSAQVRGKLAPMRIAAMDNALENVSANRFRMQPGMLDPVGMPIAGTHDQRSNGYRPAPGNALPDATGTAPTCGKKGMSRFSRGCGRVAAF
jgi:hypothetical protein